MKETTSGATSSDSTTRDESSLSNLFTVAVMDKGTKSSPKSTIPTVISKTAELYLWDQDSGHFLKQADVLGSISPRSLSYDFWMTATTDVGQQLLSHKITSELNARWSTKLSTVTWNHTSRLGHLSSWCLKFEGPKDCRGFWEAYSACLYEATNAASWQKVKVSLRHLAQGRV